MSTSLAIREDVNIAQLSEIGGIFAKSGYFKDVRDAAQAVVKIMYGKELGFSPVISMMGIHIIEGKPALSSNLMAGMVKRSGKYDYRVVKLTDTECNLMFLQGGQEVGPSNFSIADATKAGVVRAGGSWTKYPRNMLFARALSNGLKLYCPDLSMCPIYNPEELGAEVSEEGNVVSHPVSAPVVTMEGKTFGKPKDTVAGAAVGGGPASSSESVGAGPTTAPIQSLPPIDDLVAMAKSAQNRMEQAIEDNPQPPSKFITRDKQLWLIENFRANLPTKYQTGPIADQMRRGWLKTEGFVNEKDEGTSSVIPDKQFKKVAAAMLNWAKEQQ